LVASSVAAVVGEAYLGRVPKSVNNDFQLFSFFSQLRTKIADKERMCRDVVFLASKIAVSRPWKPVFWEIGGHHSQNRPLALLKPQIRRKRDLPDRTASRAAEDFIDTG